jgi:hypothetical protein
MGNDHFVDPQQKMSGDLAVSISLDVYSDMMISKYGAAAGQRGIA